MQAVNRIADHVQSPEAATRPSFIWERLPCLDSIEELPDSIANDLIRRSGFSATPGPWMSRSRIHRGYDRASRLLADLREETHQFISAIVDGTMQFEGFDPSHSVAEKTAKDVLRQVAGQFLKFRHSQSPNIKTLELLGKPKAELAHTYAEELSCDVCLYVTEMFPLLDNLGARGLLGRIKYAGERNENAEFTFFRSKAILEVSDTQQQELHRRRRTNYLLNGAKWNDTVVTNKTTVTGNILLRHAWHTHLLSEVSVVPIDSWQHPLPPRIKLIVDAIPSVLFPAARIVSGTVEFIRIVEKDLTRIPFEYSSLSETEERTRHYDPAVVIGNWVIAGWCDTETPKSSLAHRLYANCVQRLGRVTP